MKALSVIIPLLWILSSCNNIPEQFEKSDKPAAITPDFKFVTVPVNAAPPSFYISQEAQDYITVFKTAVGQIAVNGRSVVADVDKWHNLIKDRDSVSVEIFLKVNDNYTLYKPFSIYISHDSIDNYVAYRLIAPGYVIYEDLRIVQRNLTNFDENDIYDTRISSTEKQGQCINCHSFQNYSGKTFQFHARAANAGTIIVEDKKIKKVNLKTDKTIAPGVYPAWHPFKNLIAYSINQTFQTFHTADIQKIEVQDDKSDLILYDVDKNTVKLIGDTSGKAECFPSWSPDGLNLYYCVTAHSLNPDSVKENYKNIRYNIARRRFNSENNTFSPEELVFNADSLGLSATFPRVSSNGQYLMVTLAQYGVFHIRHKDADLYMIDLKSGKGRFVSELNSNNTESYHSWSKNGKWVIFSSCRNDGSYTRLYISHFNDDATFTKPFPIPQSNPLNDKLLLRSYNIPEFINTPVEVSPQNIADIMLGNAQKCSYGGNAESH